LHPGPTPGCPWAPWSAPTLLKPGAPLYKADQGRGFASEAAHAVLHECRSAGIERVWASIRPHNTPSRRIAERLGMRIDRTDHDDRGALIFYVIDLRRAEA
jgi:RimJ/RimL family protein N-acetyltransferase